MDSMQCAKHLMSLPQLPSAESYSDKPDLSLLQPAVSRLLELLEHPPPFHADVADLACAVTVAINRHRAIVDPEEEEPCGIKTLTARAVALKLTMVESGLDRLIRRVFELRDTIFFNQELDARQAVALFAIWHAPLWVWNGAPIVYLLWNYCP